ncbi:reverse transcriptase family protein [Xanthomonas graminis]|uniref:reverse transcriptase family protein n=1 Tax=Xanthomonas graminis TaxID=3390026 RepID=UPI0009BF3D36|nr:reverse transcriptase family protein [Xanthomonas translucens]
MSLDNYVPQLSRPSSVEQLAKALGVATQIFTFIVENDDPERIYRRHLIPKRAPRRLPLVPVEDAGGIVEVSLDSFDFSRYRIVWEAQNPVIKVAHRSAARVLERYLSRPGSQYPHEAAFGYIKGRSTRHNARRHSGAKHLLSADIKDFFPSITLARIELALEQAGLNSTVCNALARFLTIKGSLPLGLSASPMIANLVATSLDHDISALAKEWGLSYTRYADDITLSGDGPLPAREIIENILKRHFFRLNKAKFRTSKKGQKHYVTGLSVADKVAPHVPRVMKRKLRQELYYIRKFGFLDHLSRSGGRGTEQHNVNRLDGTVNYVSSIEASFGYKLRSDWKGICEDNGISRSFEPRPVINLRHASWFIDEAEIIHPDGTRLLALCLADVLEHDRLNVELVTLFAEEAGDAFGTADSLSIIRKGLHWAEATWSQREAVVKLLAVSPFRAIVAVAPLPNPQEYSRVYTDLLKQILATALKTSDDAAVNMYVEENRSKVAESEVQIAVKTAYFDLEEKNQRRPLKLPCVNIVPKGATPCCCVPDILLGALHRYAISKKVDAESGLAVTLFERLRNRYSVIFDGHAEKIYHHRSPFKRW